MRILNRNRRLGWMVLVLVLCQILAIPQFSALAENTINLEEDCSLTISISESFSEQYPELRELVIPVRLYRVADMNENGSVGNPAAGFEGFDMTHFRSDASAEELNDFTQALAARLEEENPPAPAVSQEITEEGTIERLPVGLYLMTADMVASGVNGFVFQPVLFSLPTTEEIEGGLHDLRYEAELYFKVEHKELYSNIYIEKELDSFNPDLGTATFVFDVEAFLEGENVYSSVVSCTFDGPGRKRLIVDRIPVGAQVTVREIYSGASYGLITAGSQSTVVLAESAEGYPAGVSFTNTYNGYQRSGTSVVNHFAYQESTAGWEYQQLPNNETARQGEATTE